MKRVPLWLALVGAWEALWLYRWNALSELCQPGTLEACETMRRAGVIVIASPGVALVAYLAGRWFAASFRRLR